MIIPCISCHRQFRLNSRLVKPTGSMVRCTNCQQIFMVYPTSEDTVNEPQRANQGQNQRGNSLGSSPPGAAKLKKLVGTNRNLNSGKKQPGSSCDPGQGSKSILDDLFGLGKTKKPQEDTDRNNNNQKNDPLPAIDAAAAAVPESESEEIQYAELPDIADIENSIDWSDVRATGQSNS